MSEKALFFEPPYTVFDRVDVLIKAIGDLSLRQGRLARDKLQYAALNGMLGRLGGIFPSLGGVVHSIHQCDIQWNCNPKDIILPQFRLFSAIGKH